jgi:hypothetical protein
MSRDEGRTWARLGRSAPVRVTASRPGLAAETLASSMLLTWNEANPAEIALSIDDPWVPGEAVELSIARNTLMAAHMPGMQGELIGLGDLRVRCSGGDTNLWIGVPEGAAAVAFRSEPVVSILADSARIVPLGQAESTIYAEAIDRELAELLDGAK